MVLLVLFAELCPSDLCDNSGTCLIGGDGEPYCLCTTDYRGVKCEKGKMQSKIFILYKCVLNSTENPLV